MRVGITYNLKSDLSSPSSPDFSAAEDAAEEFDSPETVEAIRRVLEEAGHEVRLLGGDLGILEKIREADIEFVFNMAEGFSGRSREAHIPAMLELLGVPYTGSDPLALALTLDKGLTKRIASSAAVPTPDFWVLYDPAAIEQISAGRFPLFVKPLWQGSSKGVRYTSRVEDREALKIEVLRIFENYRGEPVLVEEYVPGRELTLGVLGNPPEVLGIMEIAFRDKSRRDFCYSLEVKRDWKNLVEYSVPPRLEGGMRRQMEEAALRLFQTLGLRDVARFDFRVTPEGKFYFLEVNPLPGLSPESGDLVILARQMGFTHRDLVLKIFDSAARRTRSS